MKIPIYIVFALMSAFTMKAQEKDNDTIERHHYNHWSVELNAGFNKPVKPFADNYYSSSRSPFELGGVQHFDLGVRYMLSSTFGLKLDVGYDDIKNQDDSHSLSFHTRMQRLGLQGVVNLGRILRFETFTGRIGLLAHAGANVSRHEVMMGIRKGRSEKDGGIMYGVTPQVRINNWLVVNADFTAMNNVRQHFNWDGSLSAKENNLTGTLFTTSLGLTVYLGDSSKKHADWYIHEAPVSKSDKELKERVGEIETLMNDTDKDGVPDYLDAENNTPAGVPVDTKGRFIDVNKNGVPDVMERKSGHARLDQEFDQEGNSGNSNTPDNVLKSLVEGGYVNIYFDVNKDTPNSGSTNSVQLIYQYLVKFPQSRIILHGFADVTGAEAANKKLSERRAQNLRSFFITAGINESRISFGGQGVDKTYPTASKTGLDQARRVSVELIK